MSVIVEFAGNHLYNVFDVPTVLGVCSKAAAAHDKSAAEGLGLIRTFRTGEYLLTVTNILLPSFALVSRLGTSAKKDLTSMSYSSHNQFPRTTSPGHLKNGFWLQTKRLSKTSTNLFPKTGPSCRAGLLEVEGAVPKIDALGSLLSEDKGREWCNRKD